jgi:hypothetical protein
VSAAAGDPASCSQLGGALRRHAVTLRTAGDALHGELAAPPEPGHRPPPVVQRSRRLLAALDRAVAGAVPELDAAGAALQGHAADLGEALAALRDLTERARTAGLRVDDTEVTVTWGVTGVADPTASAVRDDRRQALQAELDQVLTVLAHRRTRLAAGLRAATDTLARHADELRR